MIAADRQIAREAHALGFSLVGMRAARRPAARGIPRRMAGRWARRRDALSRAPAGRAPRSATRVAVGALDRRARHSRTSRRRRRRSDWRRELRGRDRGLRARTRLPRSRSRGLLRAPDRRPERTMAGCDLPPVRRHRCRSSSASGRCARGLGWIGRNTLAPAPARGLVLLPRRAAHRPRARRRPLPADHCGTCTRCLDRLPDRRARPTTRWTRAAASPT